MRMSRRRRYRIEQFESRVLLSVTFNGTSGPDTIVMFRSGAGEHVVINGTDHVTSDSVIKVNALEGNDNIDIQSTSTSVFSPDDYTINCGSGQDSVTGASGDFGNDIGAHVVVTANDLSGLD